MGIFVFSNQFTFRHFHFNKFVRPLHNFNFKTSFIHPILHKTKIPCTNKIMTFYTYILTCKNGTLYTGHTNNIQNRLCQHNNGSGAKYTNYNKPCVLSYYETFETRSLAMKREIAIKKLSRPNKLALLKDFSDPLNCIK